MSVMDGIKGFFNMDDAYTNEDDFNYGYEDESDYGEYDDEPAKGGGFGSSRFSKKEKEFDDVDDDFGQARPARPARKSRGSKVVSLSSQRSNYKAEIITIKPTSMDDSKEVVENLLSGKAIILNFEGTNTDMAQRVIDSVSGACCAVDGTIKKISGYIYIVTPSSIGIEGDFSDLSSPDFNYNSRGGRYQY